MKNPLRLLAVTALLLSAWLFPAANSYAACSSGYVDDVYLNEYFFGTDPNFLEVFIPNNNKLSPTETEFWNIRVYDAADSYTDYPLSSNNPYTTICDIGSKSYITYDVPGGLPGTGTPINVVLLDGNGDEVDYLNFDNKLPLTEHTQPQCSYPANHDTDLLISNYGNKDVARFPDGNGDWSISSQTGANTSYTRCKSNNAGITKTVSASTIPVGTTGTFTIEVTNPDRKAISVAVVDDQWPAELTYESHTASSGLYDPLTHTWTIGTLASQTSATLTINFHGTTVGSYTNNAVLTYLDSKLNAYSVNDYAIANIVEPPVTGPDHLRLYHTGSGLTCSPSMITIEACADNNTPCSPYTDPVTVTLSTDGNNEANSVTLTNGSGSYDLWHTTAETVTLGASASPAANNPTRCFLGDGSESCSHTFSTSGFTFSIPAQTSAKTSAPITISAVKADPADPQSCGPAFNDSGARDINFWSSYISPSPYSGTPALQVNGQDVAGASPGTPISLSFDENAQSTFTVQFPDAGLLQLDAQYSSSTGSDAGLVMNGANQFPVKPAGYCVYSPDANAACPSGDASCSAFVAAGAPFNLALRAVAWESDTDTDLCSGNATTPNFQTTGIPLSHSLISPAGGQPGALGVTSVDIVANGTATLTNQSLSEVGVFSISAGSSGYHGTTTNPGTSAYLGRFYADSFNLSLTQPEFAPANGNFTYLGQAFQYATAPDLTLTALSASGTTLQNYQGNFWKLGSDIVADSSLANCQSGNYSCYVYSDNVGGSATLSPTTNAIAFSSYIDTATFAGSGTLSAIQSTDNFSYAKPTNPIAPFDGDIQFQVYLEDSDGATGSALLNNIGFSSLYESDATAPFNTTNDGLLRFGRAALSDTVARGTASGTTAYLPLDVQYYDGVDFISNTDDTSTSVTHSSAVPALSCSDPDTTNDTLTCGVASIQDPVTVTNPGSFPISLTSDINDSGGTLLYELYNTIPPSYLAYDWNGDGTIDSTDRASASVTFAPPSYYHGDKRFIYWQERQQ